MTSPVSETRAHDSWLDAAPQAGSAGDSLPWRVDRRTYEILERRRNTRAGRRRGWLVRRALLAADVAGLCAAFLAGELLASTRAGLLTPPSEWLTFVIIVPLWVVGAKLFGLYERDEERTNHSTADDVVRVLLLATLGAFLLMRIPSSWGLFDPDESRITVLWAASVALVVLARCTARAIARRSMTYLQNAVIVGAGEIGQLVARKILQHHEYGINLVGLVDSEPREMRPELEHLTVFGGPENLPEIVRVFDVERVIVAFSNDSHEELLSVVRSLREYGVQIDIVPRLFEVVGPRVSIHDVEGLALVGLSPVRLTPSSRLIKRALDVAAAAALLVLVAPLFALIALQIKLDSPGPVFFRQRRLGLGMKEFTALKFRTMHTGTSDEVHREFVRATMDYRAQPAANGLYKLDRTDAITRFGALLRRTSLDELPQLINVLRGDMSLVGPRPCLRYEVEHFAPHHFERFLVPPGVTGLWQVTARARSTFGEALDMDVAYVRGWSLGLDLRLLCRTPLELLRPRATR